MDSPEYNMRRATALKVENSSKHEKEQKKKIEAERPPPSENENKQTEKKKKRDLNLTKNARKHQRCNNNREKQQQQQHIYKHCFIHTTPLTPPRCLRSQLAQQYNNRKRHLHSSLNKQINKKK